jgi:hydroxylaminobenzene mutase
MESGQAERSLVRAGFILIALALLTGFALPGFVNPRMGLAAHLTGVLNGLILIGVGLSWGLFRQGPGQARLTRGTVLYATYANWAASCLAASWGTSRMTPLSGAGHSAAPWQETVVQGLQVSLALVILVGTVSVVYALRPRGSAA